MPPRGVIRLVRVRCSISPVSYFPHKANFLFHWLGTRQTSSKTMQLYTVVRLITYWRRCLLPSQDSWPGLDNGAETDKGVIFPAWTDSRHAEIHDRQYPSLYCHGLAGATGGQSGGGG